MPLVSAGSLYQPAREPQPKRRPSVSPDMPVSNVMVKIYDGLAMAAMKHRRDRELRGRFWTLVGEYGK